MNKKIITLIIAIFVILVIVAGVVIATNMNKNENNSKQINSENLEQSTNKQENISQNVSDNENSESNQTTSNNSKTLVAFFSKAGENYSVGTVEAGNTELMANNIANMVDGDLFKIEPINDYPDNYEEATNVARQEQSANSRPEIKSKIQNIDDYDTIFIGYPIWYGDMPQILYTFLEGYDFSGKTIIPFNTHEGSGESGTYSTIKSKLSNSNVLEGLAIRGSDARKDASKTTIENWLNKIGF